MGVIGYPSFPQRKTERESITLMITFAENQLVFGSPGAYNMRGRINLESPFPTSGNYDKEGEKI